MNLYEKPRGVETRWASFENRTARRGEGGQENRGAKGHPCESLAPGETKTLLDISGSGLVTRLWMTIGERSPEMLRGLRLDFFWDGAAVPAVSCPLGDFFGIGLGRRAPFQATLFSDPEGRSFNCFVPMPFRRGARLAVTNETARPLRHLFYDAAVLLGVSHSDETLYFHAHWRRESPNRLGEDFLILPPVPGAGRFLGCNVGVIADPAYGTAWWGEGEVKVWLGDDAHPTLCGSGTEDYIGTAWGQGLYAHPSQGCLVADPARRQWAFYRHHLDDPVFFDDGCRVAIQAMGGARKEEVVRLQDAGAPLVPVTIDADDGSGYLRLLDRPGATDLRDPALPDGWCNFLRQDDWSATAYFYLNAPGGVLPPLAPVAERTAGLTEVGESGARADG